MKRLGQMNLTVDLGQGRQADIEIGESDRLWIASGPGFGVTDLWLKTDGHMIDLRVRVRRTEQGIEISVDRGDDEQSWWSATASPRLAIIADPVGGRVRALASVGKEEDFQEVVLGETAI